MVPSTGWTTRHRNGIVVQNFVSNIDTCCHRSAYRQITGMEIGAITQILEYMR
jgi:hypothetical protein